MPTSFKVPVRLDIPRQLLWRVRSTRAFADFLVSQGALARMELSPSSPHHSSPTALTRRQVIVAAEVAIPEMLKSTFDDKFFEVTDEQVWDDTNRPFIQSSLIKPNLFAELISTSLTLSVEPDTSNSQPHFASEDCDPAHESALGCVHTLVGHATVSVPFLGYLAEQAIIANIDSFYEKYPRYVKDFVRMLVHKYGDGTLNSLSAAIDAVLKEEKQP